MNQDSQVSKSVLEPIPRLSAGAILRRIVLFLGCIPLLASIALAQGGFQTGTVAGALVFDGVLETGVVHGASDPMSVPLPASR